MLAVCSICVSKFVGSTDDIITTPCGHIFHYACILQWLETSKSCPQCRRKTNEKNLTKLFFDIPSDTAQEDLGLVQNQNDSLQFQMTLKNKEIRNVKEELEKNKINSEAVKKECLKLNDDLKGKNILITDLKMQISYLKGGIKDLESAKKRAKKAEATLKTLELVEKIYTDNYADIESIIHDCGTGSNMEENISSLATISSIMQKKLGDATKEKSKFADDIKILKMKVKAAGKSTVVKDMQIRSLEKRTELLQTDVNNLENENSTLSKKVDAFRDAIITPSGSVKNKIINRLLTENVIPENFKRLKDCDESIAENFITPEVVRSIPNPLRKADKIEENSPYIRLKSGSVNPFSTYNSKIPLCKNKKAASSPIISKSKLHQFYTLESSPDFGYDGLGGHHKADDFTQAKPMIKKLKRVNIVYKGKNNSTKVVPIQKINDYFKNTFAE